MSLIIKTVLIVLTTILFSCQSKETHYKKKAEDYYKAQQYEKAALFYTKALSVVETDYDSMFKLGSCHLELEQFEKAREYFHACIDNDFRTIDAHVNLSIIFVMTADYKKAKETLIKARQIDSSDNEIELMLQDIEVMKLHNDTLIQLEKE